MFRVKVKYQLENTWLFLFVNFWNNELVLLYSNQINILKVDIKYHFEPNKIFGQASSSFGESLRLSPNIYSYNRRTFGGHSVNAFFMHCCNLFTKFFWILNIATLSCDKILSLSIIAFLIPIKINVNALKTSEEHLGNNFKLIT